MEEQNLASFITSLGKDEALRVEENLGEGFVRLRVAEAERRQAAHDIRCVEDALIELLRNARDADAHLIFVATSREGDERRLTVIDDGAGIPKHLWEKVFEARVTSKLERVHLDRWGVHGRGMALFAIAQNTRDAQVMDSKVSGGCALRVIVDTKRLTERADQSSWPTMVAGDDDGTIPRLRGPHNLLRTCCEFALEEKDRCEVYVGSPAEIAATIRARVRSGPTGAAALGISDLSTLPVCERLRLAADASELQQLAAGLGLQLSERTAHRVLSGEIRPQMSVVARMSHHGGKSSPEGAHRGSERTVNLSADRRGLRLSDEDRAAFTTQMERDFEQLAERYYLTLTGSPRIRVSSNRLTVSFDFTSED